MEFVILFSLKRQIAFKRESFIELFSHDQGLELLKFTLGKKRYQLLRQSSAG